MKVGKVAEEMKKRFSAALKKRQMVYGLLFGAGFLLVLSPVYGRTFQRFQCQKAIEAYEQKTAVQEEAAQASILHEAREYNRQIAEAGAFGSFGAQADTAGREETLPEYDRGMMGWLEIPALGTSVPIRGEKAGSGAAWLKGSSLPAGEADANCVLVNKGGLMGELSRLQEGDYLYLHVLGQTLAYRVDEIQTVAKDDADQAAVQSGRDLVTLLGSTKDFSGSDRLMISAERTDYSPTIYKAQSGMQP